MSIFFSCSGCTMLTSSLGLMNSDGIGLQDRFMRNGRSDLHSLIPLKKDPAVIMMNRLKQTRCVVRMAKLGDGVYGTGTGGRGKAYIAPPVADLVLSKPWPTCLDALRKAARSLYGTS